LSEVVVNPYRFVAGEVTIIEQPANGTLIVSLSDGHPYAGYRVASGSNVIGYTLNSLTWRIFRKGSPPAGLIQARVFTGGASGSPGDYTQIGASIDQTTVATDTAGTDYTFDGSGEVTLKEGDYITVASTNGGTSSSHMVKVTGANSCDNFTTGTNLEYSQYDGGAWNNDDNLCASYGEPVCTAIGF